MALIEAAEGCLSAGSDTKGRSHDKSEKALQKKKGVRAPFPFCLPFLKGQLVESRSEGLDRLRRLGPLEEGHPKDASIPKQTRKSLPLTRPQRLKRRASNEVFSLTLKNFARLNIWQSGAVPVWLSALFLWE